MFTIDASVWVNADSPAEAEYHSSRTLLDTLIANGATIVAPILLPIELAGVIARTRDDSVLAGEMAVALFALPNIRWVALDDVVALQAAALAAEHRLRGADAVYAAVALIHGCDLVSLDHEHLTQLTSVVRTLTPADALRRLKGA